MSSEQINHTEIGLSRIALQYSESEKFRAWISALMGFAQELETSYQQIALQTDIDIATGVNLDVIGDIVGVSRIIPASIAVQFFGFEAQPGATVFGEEGTAIGARFRNEGESDVATSVLQDPEFRLLIRAKIIKNHSRGTTEDLLAGLAYLANTDAAVVEDLGDMAIGVAIGRLLTFQEVALIATLDILPRPDGVRIAWRAMYDAEKYFGFDGQPNAKPFGEEGTLAIGGLFAEEF